MSEEAKKLDKNKDNEEPFSMDVDDNQECDSDDESITEVNNESSNNTPNVSNPRRSRSNLTPADRSLRNQMRLESAKKKQEEKERKERERKEREEVARKKREEEEQLKLKRQEERERLAQERAEKERLRLEAQKKREEERRLKKEKEEEERIKKEEERKQKEEERRLKKEKEEEEKRQREEERKQKEEERRLRKEKEEEEKKQREKERIAREEEKQREEEEKRRKAEKAKENFVSFFIKKESPKKNNNNNSKDEQQKTRFMPFQPKENMRIAPICRRDDILKMNEQEKKDFIKQLDEQIFSDHTEKSFANYLELIKKNSNVIRKQTTSCRKLTKKTKSNDDIEEVFNINVRTKYKVKYLHFDPKVFRRPPYYGTWRQKSKFVKPRRPFAKDEKSLNYDVDSDDEWEDEPDGESIASSAGDEDEEIPEEDDDDGFFVPHGHLSDDELDEDDRQLDPEIKKAREAAKKEQWETERKKASKMLVPKYFINANYCSTETKKNYQNSNEYKLLERLQMVPLVTSFPIQIQNDNANKVPNTDDLATPKQKKTNNLNNNLNESSPSSVNKNTKQNKKNQNIQQQQQQNTQNSITASTDQQQLLNQSNNQPKQAPANQPNILSFMSKKTNKVCKLEQLNAASPTSNNKTDIIVLDTKSPAPSAITTKPTQATPSSIVQAQKVNSSPRMTPTNSTTNLNSTAEKRVCSGNGENAVKRFRLDQSQSVDQNGVQILTLFKQGAKKSLKLGESNRVSLGSPAGGNSNTTSTNDNIQKMDVHESNDSEKLINKNGKENKECIVLDE